jgi:hypothetical protein
VFVAVERHVVAFVVRERNLVGPQLRPLGDLVDDLAQLLLVETRTSMPSSRTVASTARAPYDDVSRKASGSTTERSAARAANRSPCSGASPASISKHTRSRGWAGRPKTRNAHQAACICWT